MPSGKREPIEGFDKTFFGDPDQSYAKADVHVGTFGIEHRFSEALTLRNRTLYGDYDKFYQNIFTTGLSAPNPLNPSEVGEQVVLDAYNSRNDRQNLFNQTDLIWNNRLGGIDQTLLVGFEVGHQKSRNLRQNGTFAGGDNRVPLSDPTVDAIVTFAPAASAANNRTKATVAAVYIQDQIRLSPMFEIVAGLRFDSFKLSVDDFNGAGAEFSRTDELLSPRLGLIFKPLPNLSLYASYSRSYLPQSGDQFGGLTLSTEALKPERFDNYELGAKWEPIAGLLATAAIYRLDRTNTRGNRTGAWHRSADRRAAQPRARAWAGAQRQRPLADFGRLCLAESGDHQDHGCRARRPRSAAGPAPHFLAVEPLRRHRCARPRPWRDCRAPNPMRRSATR